MPLLYIDIVEGRTREFKERFYKVLASSVTENDDEDWSFGHGRAQFLTGELK